MYIVFACGGIEPSLSLGALYCTTAGVAVAAVINKLQLVEIIVVAEMFCV